MSDAIAERLAAALARAGTRLAFGVPGGGPNLALIEALDAVGIGFVLAHGETAAAIMASANGHLTGAPSAVIVTRGPGAASAINGTAQATLDRHPLVVVTDTVPAADAARGVAHQRIDQPALFAPVSRHSATISASTGPDELDRLLAIATGPPAGAVHLDIDPSAPTAPSPAAIEAESSVPLVEQRPSNDLDRAAALVAAADQPVVIVGLGGLDQSDRLRTALERFGAPVLTTYQGVGALPSEHDQNGGLFTNGASEGPLLDRADLVMTIGLDPVEPIPAPWSRTVPIVSVVTHATTDPYLPVDVELIGDPAALAEQLLIGPHRWRPTDGAEHRQRVLAELSREGTAGDPVDGIDPVTLVRTLAADAPDQLLVTVDAGAHFLAVLPFWPVRRPGDLLISNGLATMGYALPAAIGASLARPERPVLCLVGDGGLGMTAAELETIARLELPITVVVFNDSALSLIRIKQGRGGAGGGGSAAVTYGETDFAGLARSFGLPAAVATTATELASLAEKSWGRPGLVDARVDPTSYPHLLAVTRS